MEGLMFKDKHGRYYSGPYGEDEPSDDNGLFVFASVLFIVLLFGLGWLTWGL